ncbi:MAG: hypothetical protein IKF38_05935 [Clostridia bacterium]|nr:hypothetical protein [Clostridia bacterium]
MNYFPKGNEEKNLIKFIAKYQYLLKKDSNLFFESNKYYMRRIKNLIDKKYIRKYKSYLVLDDLGIEYAKQFNFEYNKINRNQKYMIRLFYLSHLGAFYNNCKTLQYIPSFSIKDKSILTKTARRYIGIFEIQGFEYLTYSITTERDYQYIKSVMYDIQKEQTYRNIIILVDNIKRLNFNDFTFGYNQVLLIDDTEENREKLKYMNNVDWKAIIDNLYGNKVHLSEYNFCDYTDSKNTYISTFYFLDTEKINRLKYFLSENRNKTADIICPPELEFEIKKHLPNVNFRIINLDEYTKKDVNIYG